jgi:DNA-binding transcriptional regulator YiaG
MQNQMAIPVFPCSQVRPLRLKLGLTQDDLANEIGVTRPLITMWERGVRSPTGPAAILLSQLQAKAGLENKPEKMAVCS